MNDEFIIHLIPGLGFDSRIFRNLHLPFQSIKHINWIEPRHLEHIEDYAYRISADFENQSVKNIIIGHSFGGVLAQEIAKVRSVEKIILLSSIRSKEELPGIFRMVNWLGIHSIFSKKNTLSTFPFWASRHGYDTPEKSQLFKDMLDQQSDKYLQWALKSLAAWDGKHESQTPLLQIHGKKDRTFPLHYLKSPDHVLEEGTHLMVYDQATKVETLIVNELNRA